MWMAGGSFKASACKLTCSCLQDHTGIKIASVLQETLESWKLHVSEEQLVCMTNDSRCNVIKAAVELWWVRLSCLDHNLHIAVNNPIKDDVLISCATGVCNKIVGTISHSWQYIVIKNANIAQHYIVGNSSPPLITSKCTCSIKVVVTMLIGFIAQLCSYTFSSLESLCRWSLSNILLAYQYTSILESSKHIQKCYWSWNSIINYMYPSFCEQIVQKFCFVV